MRVLGLDMSSKTGYAFLDNEKLSSYGLIQAFKDDSLYDLVEDYKYMGAAKEIARDINNLFEDSGEPDFVCIEQTNKGRDRNSQKYLEFIHFAVLDLLKVRGMERRVRYIDTSFWRRALKISLSKEQRAHNKLVKQGKARGKITPKHLAVNWANSRYNLNLLLKDNDIADAIAVATCGYTNESKHKPNVTPNQIEQLFAGQG